MQLLFPDRAPAQNERAGLVVHPDPQMHDGPLGNESLAFDPDAAFRQIFCGTVESFAGEGIIFATGQDLDEDRSFGIHPWMFPSFHKFHL